MSFRYFLIEFLQCDDFTVFYIVTSKIPVRQKVELSDCSRPKARRQIYLTPNLSVIFWSLTMRISAILLSLSTLATIDGVAHASTNLVKNGNFELTSNGTKQIGAVASAKRTTVLDWTSGGYNFVFNGANADSVGSNGLTLWGPHTYNGTDKKSQNGLGVSPSGGNFIGSDPIYYPAPISQTISGLTVGGLYTLTFDYALAQQVGFTGANTDAYWSVVLGLESQNTSKLSIASEGFSGWKEASMTFKATSSKEVLSFLAKGGPAGAPPFMLLDGVTMVEAVPEPSTYAMLLGGLGVIGFMARRRRAPQA